MAKQITELSTAAAVNDTADLLWIEQGGLPRKITPTALIGSSTAPATPNFVRYTQTVVVPAGGALTKIVDELGNDFTVSDTGELLVRVYIPSTGTDTGLVGAFYSDAGAWTAVTHYASGVSSNHPRIGLDAGGLPAVGHYHASAYTLAVEVIRTINRSTFSTDETAWRLNGTQGATAFGWGDHASGGYASLALTIPYAEGGTIDVNADNGSGIFMGTTGSWTNNGPKGNNAGGLLSFNTHPGNYFSQLWFDTGGGGTYVRHASNVLPTGAWAKLLTDLDVTDTEQSNWNTAFGWGDHSTQNYAVTTGDTFTGAVTIDTDAAASALTIGDGLGADGDILLTLSTDRPWNFKQGSTGASTSLSLNSTNAAKNFYIREVDVIKHTFTSSGNYIAVGTGTFGGALKVGGDTIGQFETVTGNYGSVQVSGAEGSSGTWHGYSIGGKLVFMDNQGTAATLRGGLYDDQQNTWVMQYNASGSSLDDLTLYCLGVVEARVQDSNASGNTSGLQTSDYGQTMRDVGFATMEEVTFVANTTVVADHWSQKCLTHTNATTHTLTFNTLTTVPNGAVMWVKARTGIVTLVDGTMVLTWYDGGALSTGNRTLAIGGWATIHKTGNSAADVTGVGLT